MAGWKTVDLLDGQPSRPRPFPLISGTGTGQCQDNIVKIPKKARIARSSNEELGSGSLVPLAPMRRARWDAAPCGGTPIAASSYGSARVGRVYRPIVRAHPPPPLASRPLSPKSSGLARLGRCGEIG
ncbi:hypothetical protein KM043_012341 [Ampulex compressa]|nr:hypothetical protein KM043_012341 [Ampulex compressa]